MSSCHGVPREAITAVTSPAAAPPAAMKYHQLTPARNITTAPPAPSRIAVPRSGCLSTSAIGTAVSASGGSSHSGRETLAGSSQS